MAAMEIECDVHWLEDQSPPYSGDYMKFLHWVWEVLGVESGRLGVVFCDEETIASYNVRFRGREGPTDVLSFGTEKPPLPAILEGDLVICPSYVESNARRFGVEPWDELLRVTLHGHLHLMGWDHGTNDEDEPMLVRQEEILKTWKQGGKA